MEFGEDTEKRWKIKNIHVWEMSRSFVCGAAMLRPEFLAALRHQASQNHVQNSKRCRSELCQTTSSLCSNCWIWLLKFLRACIQRGRGRWVVGRVWASQCFGRARIFFCFTSGVASTLTLIHFCCSSHPFTAFLMRQRNHGGSSCMPGAFAQRLVFCRLSGLVAHLLSDDAAAWCTTTMGCTWQSEGAFFKSMQLLTQNTVTMWICFCSVCYPNSVL